MTIEEERVVTKNYTDFVFKYLDNLRAVASEMQRILYPFSID